MNKAYVFVTETGIPGSSACADDDETGAVSTVDSYAHCEALVRAADKDRFLASLFAPAERRRRLFALYAFNAEIARVREVVRTPIAGEIRLQWWRDALEASAPSEVRANPVADALIDTIAACRLPVEPLLALIEARSFDLYDDPMPTLDTLYGYVRKTSSTLIELAAIILGGADPIAKRPRRTGRDRVRTCAAAAGLSDPCRAWPALSAARPARPLRRRRRRGLCRPGERRNCARRCPICGGARALSSTRSRPPATAWRRRRDPHSFPLRLPVCCSIACTHAPPIRSFLSRWRSGAGNGRCGSPRATSRACFSLNRTSFLEKR